MINVTCYDSDGNALSHLTQWDIGRTLVVKGATTVIEPVFHFCNTRSTEALVVPSKINNGSIITKIPNLLLQSSFPIIAHMYYQESKDSAKTLYTITIPVVPRVKPFDYNYVENIEYANWVMLEKEARELVSKLEQADFCVDGEYLQSTLDGRNWKKLIALSSLEGRGIKSIVAQYARQAVKELFTSAGEALESADGEQIEVVLTGASWGPDVPEWKNGYYIWKRLVITYTDNTQTITNPVCITGPKGNTGETGNGIKSVIRYYLSSNLSEGVNTSTSGWTTTMQSTTASKRYLWSYDMVTYTNGDLYKSTPVIIGTQGATGQTGADGVSVTHVWNGTTLSITSASGTSSSNLKGDTGDKGDKGDKGDAFTYEDFSDEQLDNLHGATFVPSVSDDGVISWSNNKGLANPAPVDVSVGMTNITISIPTSAWVNDSSISALYVYYADISHEAVLSTQYPVGAPTIDCLDKAQSCGLAPVVQTLDGVIRFFSESIPDIDLTVDIALWKK